MAGLCLGCADAVLAGPKPPQCPTNWQTEVILDSPAISAPTVLCCSPDGRIFMGEDPIDMGSPSDAALDKIVSIYPDGQVLTFATNLHAVFGLQYTDGRVFVHHTPEFSVFDDFHGVGINRKDIITNDNPHPWSPTFNDHIPSGFKLAMDGYFYFTTGDKGIKGATGPDGRKIEIHGGGIYRMRPDGTGLEVYSTGTRNHLDPAINAEDEIFTYDNTDDGGGWWKRVTHMVDGGIYGYPYDFKPQRPYTLWRMDEYGGGAPTGALAYNEDALPDEYKGNLFLCDWGGEVLRLKIERDGATYKIAEKISFMTKGTSDDFRPVGICVSPDGKSFYITDWGRSYWKRDEKMGRLLKVTYKGKTQETPKPDWFVPAATGEEFHATTAELVKALSHPAESVRLVAQRRLVERGRAAVRDVLKLMKDGRAPSYARWFALWTLDAIDGGKKESKAILAALKDKDISLEMQAARELGTRSVEKAVPGLMAMLRSTNAAVRFRANTALGRICDPVAIPALMKELDQKDMFARYAAFTALRHIGVAHPKTWPQIVEGFASTNAAIREGTGFAVRETYDPALVSALADFSARQNISLPTRTNIFGLLASVSLQRAPWNGDWWSTQPVNGIPPPKTNNWEGTRIVAAALRSAITDREVAIRKIGIDWVRSAHDTNAATELAMLFHRETDTSVRAGILRDIAAVPSKEGTAVVASVLRDPQAPMELLLAAIESAAKLEGGRWNQDLIALGKKTKEERLLVVLTDFYGEKKLSATIPFLTNQLFQTNSTLRQHTVDALKTIGGDSVVDAFTENLSTANADFRKQLILALGAMKAKAAVPALIKCAALPESHDAAVEALTHVPDTAAIDIYLDGLSSKNASLRKQCEVAVGAIKKQALPFVEARVGTNDLPDLALTTLKQIYQNDSDAKKSSIFRRKILEISPDKFQEFALAHPGDPKRGKALFHDLKGMGCIRCHRIDGQGGDIGPDLAGIHDKYPRSFIIESVLYPSKQIMDGYAQTFFETKDDEEISGIVKSETPEEITLVDSSGSKHVLKQSNIKSRKVSQISLMPEGLQSGLSLAEFSDLISYVENPAVPEAPKTTPMASHAPRTVPPVPDPSRPALTLEPEPGTDLFSFLDVAPAPERNVPVDPDQAEMQPPHPSTPRARKIPPPRPTIDASKRLLGPAMPPSPPGPNPPPAPTPQLPSN